jgi:hypothetical protein
MAIWKAEKEIEYKMKVAEWNGPRVVICQAC